MPKHFRSRCGGVLARAAELRRAVAGYDEPVLMAMIEAVHKKANELQAKALKLGCGSRG